MSERLRHAAVEHPLAQRACLAWALAALAAAILVGGRDPLDFGPAWVIVAWPVVAIVAAVGLVALWAATDEVS